MSFLKKSLQKRIRELRASIDAQKIELAAYEQVLALESGQSVEGLAPAPAALAAVVKKHTAASKSTVTSSFNGNRSDFVASILKERGAAGVTPAEISQAFAAQKIAVGKNLVYNVLSLMFTQRKVRKSGGKYYLLSAKPATKRISEQHMKRVIAATKKQQAVRKRR
jgi:hypothetical protein